jgi:hypothetical protein
VNTKPNTIYKSKIANVPTPGYAGHTSIFIKPISYLNKDKIDAEDTKQTFEDYELSPAFMKTLNNNNNEEEVILLLISYHMLLDIKDLEQE